MLLKHSSSVQNTKISRIKLQKLYKYSKLSGKILAAEILNSIEVPIFEDDFYCMPVFLTNIKYIFVDEVIFSKFLLVSPVAKL